MSFGTVLRLVFAVLRTVHPDVTMTNRSISIMNSFLFDVLDRMGYEAAQLALHSARSTVSSLTFEASHLLFPARVFVGIK
jgi:histone H2B